MAIKQGEAPLVRGEIISGVQVPGKEGHDEILPGRIIVEQGFVECHLGGEQTVRGRKLTGRTE